MTHHALLPFVMTRKDSSPVFHVNRVQKTEVDKDGWNSDTGQLRCPSKTIGNLIVRISRNLPSGKYLIHLFIRLSDGLTDLLVVFLVGGLGPFLTFRTQLIIVGFGLNEH